MLYFIIFLQMFFNVFLIFFYKKKLAHKVFLKEAKDEINDLIVSFNEYAHRNISIIEDRVVEARELVGVLEKNKISSTQKDLLLLEKNLETEKNSRKKKVQKTSFNKKRPDASKQKILEKNIAPLLSYTPRKEELYKHTSQAGIENYFEEKIQERVAKMSVEEKCLYYKKKKMSDVEIAKKLNLSLGEISLFTMHKKVSNNLLQ